jgi:hypothetical protein
VAAGRNEPHIAVRLADSRTELAHLAVKANRPA